MATKFADATTARQPSTRKIAPRRAARTADAAPRADIYQEVTDRIIADLEAGIAPWVCPWNKSAIAAPISLPVNASTGKTYSGMNILLLWSAMAKGGFATNAWMTFKQAEALGGMVRKGSKGSMIVFADRFIPEAEKARAAQTGNAEQAVFFMKRHTVFNLDQIDNLPANVLAKIKVEPVSEREQHEAGERLIAASGADFRVGGDKAYYVPSHDFIAVPDQRQFRDQVNFYRTACHELTHWTGHGSRLARRLLNEFGSADYAREELVAEMGSAFVCASLGIAPTVRHSDYIGNWLTVLRGDKRAIFKAANLASKAADFLLAKMEG